MTPARCRLHRLALYYARRASNADAQRRCVDALLMMTGGRRRDNSVVFRLRP